mmetsp:Transcript_279/g.624  ORF Transcript_279/g.624 Transcript_279/m.624 type:complete len:147 (-) Transcript_279:34-474(-)
MNRASLRCSTPERADWPEERSTAGNIHTSGEGFRPYCPTTKKQRSSGKTEGPIFVSIDAKILTNRGDSTTTPIQRQNSQFWLFSTPSQSATPIYELPNDSLYHACKIGKWKKKSICQACLNSKVTQKHGPLESYMYKLVGLPMLCY